MAIFQNEMTEEVANYIFVFNVCSRDKQSVLVFPESSIKYNTVTCVTAIFSDIVLHLS